VLFLSTSVCLYCLTIECAVIAVAVNGMTRICSSSVEWLIPLVCLSICARVPRVTQYDQSDKYRLY
jgi:hypothetical protein